MKSISLASKKILELDKGLSAQANENMSKPMLGTNYFV